MSGARHLGKDAPQLFPQSRRLRPGATCRHHFDHRRSLGSLLLNEVEQRAERAPGRFRRPTDLFQVRLEDCRRQFDSVTEMTVEAALADPRASGDPAQRNRCAVGHELDTGGIDQCLPVRRAGRWAPVGLARSAGHSRRACFRALRAGVMNSHHVHPNPTGQKCPVRWHPYARPHPGVRRPGVDPAQRGMTMDISDKVFVVTGGGAGIGQATVHELLARGAQVAAVDLNEQGLQETAEQAGDEAQLSIHALNVTDREAVLALPDRVITHHGAVDGLINVAGIIQPFVHVKDLEFEQIERVMDVNFWGTVTMVKAFLPHLLERPAASLINVSSMGAILPVPRQTAYGASKAAVALLTEGLYAELQGTSVHVTEVFPGAVGTEITKNSGVKQADGAKTASEAKTTSPQEAGRQIAEAVEKQQFRLHIGNDAKLFDRLSRMIPQRAIRLIAKRMKDVG